MVLEVAGIFTGKLSKEYTGMFKAIISHAVGLFLVYSWWKGANQETEVIRGTWKNVHASFGLL